MTAKTSLPQGLEKYLTVRGASLEKIENNEEFKAAGVTTHPHDSLGVNLPRFLELFENSGSADFLGENGVERTLDIAGANGDVALVFAMSGYEASVSDLTLPWARGPLVASLLNEELNANLRVIDFDVDRHFDYADLEKNTFNAGQYNHVHERSSFDLITCTGLLYHLKNPFAFLESVRKLTRYAIIGTQIVNYFPDGEQRIDETGLVYLLDRAELNQDPTNFWIFTNESFHRLARLCNFRVICEARAPYEKTPHSVPSEQGYLLLEAV